MLLCTSLAMLPSQAFAESIGIINMQKIFLSYNKSKKFQKEFDKKKEKLQKEFEKRQKKILKAKEKGKDEKKIKKLIEEMEEELKPKQDDLIQYNNALTGELRTDILQAATSLAKYYNIDVVLDKQAVIIGGFDITDFVIEKLNSKK